jgi:aminoglycoside 6'-N-acetyltransferase
VQYFPVGQWAAEYDIEDATDTWAIDIFIGEPDHWSRGVGSAALRALLGYLFEREGASRVLIDPRVVNERAIRCYEKAGFRKVKVLAGHEEHEGEKWDCWLMEAAGAS